MSEIILRLPSKTVQYGYVEIKGSPEEFGIDVGVSDPVLLGVLYVNYVKAFQASERAHNGAPKAVDPLLVPDVLAPQASPAEEPPGSPRAAADRVANDQKPRTVDEAEEMAKQLIERELGGVVVSEKPWENEALAVTKPWEAAQPASLNLFG